MANSIRWCKFGCGRTVLRNYTAPMNRKIESRKQKNLKCEECNRKMSLDEHERYWKEGIYK